MRTLRGRAGLVVAPVTEPVDVKALTEMVRVALESAAECDIEHMASNPLAALDALLAEVDRRELERNVAVSFIPAARVEDYKRRLALVLAAAGSPTGEETPRCICPRFGDLAEGTIVADLTCPIHGVNGTDPGDVIPGWPGHYGRHDEAAAVPLAEEET